MMRINLIPIDQRPIKQGKIRWEFGAIVLAVVLIIVINGFGYVQRIKVQSLDYEYRSLQDYNMILTHQRAVINDLETELKDQKERLEYYLDLITENEILKFTYNLPDQLWFDSMEINENYSTLTGYTLDPFIVKDLTVDLRELGMEAQIRNLNSVSNDSLVRFTLDLQRR